MKFAPKPENDFVEFIRIYYQECRYRFPKIEGIAGKWMFRDLIPGMSDFDTRFVLNDDMTVEDWCRFSTAVGQVHLALCEKYRCWARNLEHLPGANPTWEELQSERSYSPEYKQWTYYYTESPEQLGAALDWLDRRPWDEKDEYFHLKKFVSFYGRYDREIDPPINLGAHENKYPLHSRVMHYFNPPVRAAACLLTRRNIVGKMEGFEVAEEIFPDLACWAPVAEILHANYETPRWYGEPNLTELEDTLEQALRVMAEALPGSTTLLPPSAGSDVQAWKRALGEIPVDPGMQIVNSTRFSRTMKGRLDFYCHAPAHFQTDWLIQNELGRIGHLFFQVPFRTYWQLLTGEKVADALDILDELRGDPLSDVEIGATKEFARLASGRCAPGRERVVAGEVVQVFDDFYRALSKISERV